MDSVLSQGLDLALLAPIWAKQMFLISLKREFSCVFLIEKREKQGNKLSRAEQKRGKRSGEGEIQNLFSAYYV